MSICLNSAKAFSTAELIELISETSAAKAKDFTPKLLISIASWSTSACVLETKITLTPSFASAMAVAFPSPLFPPVISAFFPFKLKCHFKADDIEIEE